MTTNPPDEHVATLMQTAANAVCLSEEEKQAIRLALQTRIDSTTQTQDGFVTATEIVLPTN